MNDSPRPTSAWWLFVALLFFFLIFGRERLLDDADMLWHIVVGHQIIAGDFKTEDIFTYTRSGEFWVAQQWVGEAMMAFAEQLAGFDGVLLLSAVILAYVFHYLGTRLLSLGLDPVLTVGFVLLFIAAAGYHLHARPLIGSVVLMAIVYRLLLRIENRELAVVHLWWAIPWLILWVNCHGGALGGIGTLGLAITGWFAAKIIGLNSPICSGKDAFHLGSILAVALLTPWCNPFGNGIPRIWYSIMTMPLDELVTEHAPLDPTHPASWPIIALGLLYGLAFFTSTTAWKTPTLWLPWVWLLLSFSRMRHASLFTVVTALALIAILRHCRLGKVIQRRGFLKEARPVPAFNRWHLAMVAGLFATAIGLTGFGQRVGWAQPGPRVWPVELLPAIEEFSADHPESKRIFNEPTLGGFLIYQVPDLKVHTDGRCELFGKEFMFEFVDAWSHPDRLEAWRKQWKFDIVLIERKSPFRKHLENNPHWSMEAETSKAQLWLYGVDQSANSPADRRESRSELD